jgi:hypothetical protein
MTNDEEINFTKVNAFISEGRLFRAKETLHGMIGSYGFRPALFTKLGDILHALGEPELAARYWYYSGDRDPRFGQAVNKYRDFLAKKAKSRSHWDVLIDIPKPLAKVGAGGFPTCLRDDFLSMGLEPDQLDRHLAYSRARENKINFAQPKSTLERIKSTALIAFGFAAFLGFFGLMIAAGSGLLQLVKYLFDS